MDMKTRYVIKGINKEQVVSSVVAIYLDGEGKIQKVQDKWDGKLPDGAIANVSPSLDAAAVLWLNTDCLQAFRHLNAVTVPKLINVPKNDKEDAERGN